MQPLLNGAPSLSDNPELKEVVENALKNVIQWLKEGSDDAAHPVDWPWDVELMEGSTGTEKAYMAFHPKAFLSLYVIPQYESGVIRLILDPLYPTKFMDLRERVELYYYLLKLNMNFGLVKASLIGDDDGVIFLVDLSAKSLGKNEFNDALEQLYLVTGAFVKAVGWEDEVSKQFMNTVLEILKDKKRKGATDKEIVSYLVQKLKMDEKLAKELVKEVLNEKPEPTRRGPTVI